MSEAPEKAPSILSLVRGIERRQRRQHAEMQSGMAMLAQRIDSLITVVQHAERLLKEKETLQAQLQRVTYEGCANPYQQGEV
jgi:hypothetical protein